MQTRCSGDVNFENGCVNMVFSDIAKAKNTAQHPYFRRCPPYWKVPKPADNSCKLSHGCLVDENVLIGLATKKGQPSLPPEDLNRIQALVEPKFAIVNDEEFLDTPRPFKDRDFSESDRKERIVKYLKGETGRVPKKIEEEIIEDLSTVYSQSADDVFETSITDDFGFTVPRAVERQSLVPICKIEVVSDSAVVQHTKSPLCKLEEMKSQLPAVAGKSQGTVARAARVDPGSPASSMSSTSSIESEEEAISARRPVTQYNGVGQIRLWQFLLQCLVNGHQGICWTNGDTYEFKFTHPEAVARAWGECKRKSKGMTYDKMGRGLRSYYKDKILRKVPEQRYMFQFLDERIRAVCRSMQQSNE